MRQMGLPLLTPMDVGADKVNVIVSCYYLRDENRNALIRKCWDRESTMIFTSSKVESKEQKTDVAFMRFA
jgi:hypothetical protein